MKYLNSPTSSDLAYGGYKMLSFPDFLVARKLAPRNRRLVFERSYRVG
jgi:hypothetical protein